MQKEKTMLRHKHLEFLQRKEGVEWERQEREEIIHQQQ